MPDFITQNPVLDGMARADQRRQSTALGDLNIDMNQLRLDEARRTRDSEVAVDEALRSFIGGKGAAAQPGAAQAPVGQVAPAQEAPQPTAGQGAVGALAPAPNRPGAVADPRQPATALRDLGGLPDRLAAVPGAGGAVLSLVQSQNQSIQAAQDAERNAAQAQQAAALNQRQALQSKVFEQFFDSLKGNDVGVMKFYAGQLGLDVPPEVLTQGVLRQRLAQAGEYKKLYGNDVASFGKFLQDAFQNESNDTPDYQGAFGRTPPTNSSQSAAGATSNPEIVKAQWLMQNLNLGAREAFQLAQNNPVTVRATVWTTAYRGAINSGLDQSEAVAEANAVTDTFIKNFGTMQLPGGPAAAPEAGAGTQEVPLDASGQVDEGQLTPNQIYTTPRGPMIWTGTEWLAAN